MNSVLSNHSISASVELTEDRGPDEFADEDDLSELPKKPLKLSVNNRIRVKRDLHGEVIEWE